MALDAVIIADSVRAGRDELERALRRRGLRTAASADELNLSPGQCALIGATLADARSSRTSGVTSLSIAGAQRVEEFRAAGARAVYRDVADLLSHLDKALKLTSPGPLHLTCGVAERMMRHALQAARQGMEAGEAPIGCALFSGDGTLLAIGHNQQNRTQSKIAHAEIVTFTAAAGKTPLDARDMIMASTLEPCVMCTGAAMEAAVDTILYGLRAPADAGSQRVACPLSAESQMPRIIGDVLAGKSRELFEEFLRSNPRPEQSAFVRQLLGQQRG